MERKYILMASILVLLVGCERLTPGAVDVGAEGTAVLDCDSSTSSPADAGGDEQSLYQRLGGYDAIAAINDAIGTRIFDDPDFDQILAGMDPESGPRVRQMSILHFCEAAGGDCTYVGRELAALHAGMGITNEHWQSFIGHVADALDELSVAKADQAEVISIFSGHRDDIVGSTY